MHQIEYLWSKGLSAFPNKPWSLCVCSTSLLKTLWEKEQLLLTSFLPIWRTFYFHQNWNCRRQTLSVWTSLKVVLCERFFFFFFGVVKSCQLFDNPFPHNDTFWCPWETSLLKTLWEKEKLLVTSNNSFSHGVFYPFGYFSAIFVKFEIVVCKLFQFERV